MKRRHADGALDANCENQPGKVDRAITWAKHTAAYVEKTHNSPTVTVYLDAFGVPGTIRWIVDFEGLATLERTRAAITADPDYLERVNEAHSNGLFAADQVDDVVMRAV